MVALVIVFALVGAVSAGDMAACMESCPKISDVADADGDMAVICEVWNCINKDAETCEDIIEMFTSNPEAAMVGCACACPTLAAMAEATGDPDMDAVCKLMTCLDANAKDCKPVTDMMAKDPSQAMVGCACACPDMMEIGNDCEDKAEEPTDGSCKQDVSKGKCAATMNGMATCIVANGGGVCKTMIKELADKDAQTCIAEAASKVAADAADGAQGLGLMGVIAALAFTMLV